MEQGLEALTHLTRQPYELFALDLLPQQEGAQLRLRLGGNPASFPQRIDQMQRFFAERQSFSAGRRARAAALAG